MGTTTRAANTTPGGSAFPSRKITRPNIAPHRHGRSAVTPRYVASANQGTAVYAAYRFEGCRNTAEYGPNP